MILINDERTLLLKVIYRLEIYVTKIHIYLNTDHHIDFDV